MSRDYIELGPVPCNASCQQVGTDSYDANLVRLECSVYRDQLERMFPNPPEDVRFSIKTFAHEFGSYKEVVVYYESEEGFLFALNVENNSPTDWDVVAKRQLGLA